MIVCPLCEAAQAEGTVCQSCGRELVPAQPVDVVSDRLPELETTSLVEGSVTPVDPADPLLDLQPTQLAGPPVPAGDPPMPDLERHHVSVPAVEVAALPDVEATRLPDDGVRTKLPDVATCPYCGWAQLEGAVCDGCGNALPRARVLPEPVGAPDGVPGLRCPGCGAMGTVGRVCASCGSPVRPKTT